MSVVFSELRDLLLAALWWLVDLVCPQGRWWMDVNRALLVGCGIG